MEALMQLNISEMKNHLSAALAKAEAGETVIICRRNKPIAELKAIEPEKKPRKKRPLGLAAKEYPDWKLGDEFFEPLPDDILAYFNGEKE
jgi:antitoxin (DNA-binding transcriptional repressor) of toxin-antitoxin stability system